MVVRWDHPVVQKQTREIVSALAEEFRKAEKFQKIEEIWDESNGPFSEVVDGTLRRNEAGLRALREELQLYVED